MSRSLGDHTSVGAGGGIGWKKDALTALYSLCLVKENKLRAVHAGIMKPLMELMVDFGSNMVDKSTYVLCILVLVQEARGRLWWDTIAVMIRFFLAAGCSGNNCISLFLVLHKRSRRYCKCAEIAWIRTGRESTSCPIKESCCASEKHPVFEIGNAFDLFLFFLHQELFYMFSFPPRREIWTHHFKCNPIG
ncbi:hypothetical protein L1049_025396 [Liquidambar formosana]|uniref:Uncharacterized protein n=1 Tax=Liquidambar formosana TaxID=63359 RepID=A0AAP0NBD3_LIQFO